jgi:hypothetical protein
MFHNDDTVNNCKIKGSNVSNGMETITGEGPSGRMNSETIFRYFRRSHPSVHSFECSARRSKFRGFAQGEGVCDIPTSLLLPLPSPLLRYYAQVEASHLFCSFAQGEGVCDIPTSLLLPFPSPLLCCHLSSLVARHTKP